MQIAARALALALVLTGAAASTYTTSNHNGAAQIAVRNSATPVPTCPPDGSTDCGFGAPIGR